MTEPEDHELPQADTDAQETGDKSVKVESTSETRDDQYADVSVLQVSQEEKKRILKERAKRLAKRPEGEEDTEQTVDVVEFSLAGERYAIEMIYIREVYPLKELTMVPCTPPHILGVINVRGQLISVTDLRELFKLKKDDLTEDARVIIVMNSELEMGILGEFISGERNIPVSQVRSEVANLTGMREQFIKGVTNDRLAVLDVTGLLSDNRIIVNEEVGE